MDMRQRSHLRSAVTGLAVVAALVATACGTATVAELDAASARASGATKSGTTSAWPLVVDFNTALATQDYAQAAALSAPLSAAATYVSYRSDVAEAQQAAGADPAPDGVVSADEKTGAVTVTIGSGADEVAYTWTDFQVDSAGLVTGWSTDQGRLDTVISAPGSQAEAGGATVSLRSAYQTNEGDLLVVVGVAADEDAVSMDDSAVVRLEGGSTAASTATVGPAEVELGQTGLVVYRFDRLPLGGTLVYEVQNSYDAPAAVELAIN